MSIARNGPTKNAPAKSDESLFAGGLDLRESRRAINISSLTGLRNSTTKHERTITSSLQVLNYLPTRIQSRRAGHPAAGMRARAAQIQFLNRRVIPRPPNQRAKREELIERHLAVMNVTAA